MSYIPSIPTSMVHVPQIQLVRMVPSMNFIPNENNDLIDDEEGKAQRADILSRQKINTTFYGLQQIFTFISGPLIGAGLAILLPGLESQFGLASEVMDEEKVKSAFRMGGMLLGAAAASIGVAIASNQISSRVMHSANFDQSEINAQHTAKYVGKAIRKELEEMQSEREMGAMQAQSAAFVFDNPDAQRTDGRAWIEVEATRQQVSGEHTLAK